MDNQSFIAMSPAERVKKVNKLLQDHDMKEISNLIGIPSSSFSKIMREGDYIYHKADKRYYPFVRSEEGMCQVLVFIPVSLALYYCTLLSATALSLGVR